jgi:tetratricopeptide (TPR) repeat protein
MGDNLAAKRLPILIGRKTELQQIGQALGPDSIILLSGTAGVGKTVLLDAAARIAENAGFLVVPIIDFYDIGMHSHALLEETIADCLDPNRRYFADYWELRQKTERSYVASRKPLIERERELWKKFSDGYRAVTQEKRILLRFDTAERLEYEEDSPEVLRDCEVPALNAPSWQWLLHRIQYLPETTVIIAARQTAKQLAASLKNIAVSISLNEFSLAETEAYFAATDSGREWLKDAPEMVEKIHLLTGGRPILVALALDWLMRGKWNKNIHSASLIELQRWEQQASANRIDGKHEEARQQWKEIRREFEKSLVQRIRGQGDSLLFEQAIRYVALCRKGCNAEMLSRLMSISRETADQLVVELTGLSFVKPPRHSTRDLFFLHDEMYELIEQYVWRVDYPEYNEQARLDQVIIDWYAEQIRKVSESLLNENDLRRRSELRQQQQLLCTERMYYQLDRDPRVGYQEYTHLDEEAIASRELDWDLLLRNEGLWFTRNRGWRLVDRGPTIRRNGVIIRNPVIDYDCRRRWIWRYIAMNEMEKAAKVAQRLLAKPHELTEPELWRAGVQLALATALAYQGGANTELALTHFQEAIDRLKTTPQDHKEPWLYPYLIGTAYLYRGLALRNWLRLSEAVDSYGSAVSFFESIEHQPRMAEALNNLAYIYARQGQFKEGLDACERALRIRRALADEYSEGLSLNTMGIIYERMGQPNEAIHYSEDALALFTSIGSERGVILAEINLGRSYRRKGHSLDLRRGDEDFRKGLDYLLHAIRLQRQQGRNAEVFYALETRIELGCLYRDWVVTLFEQGGVSQDLAQRYLDRAEDHLLGAISRSTAHGSVPWHNLIQHADSMEDLARVYYWRGKLRLPVGRYGGRIGKESPYEVERALLNSILKEMQRNPGERWEEMDLVLGKAYVQYARLERENANATDAARYYALATGLLEQYSLDAPELHKAISDVSAWLIALPQNEVEILVQAMATTVTEQSLSSLRLRGAVNTLIYTFKHVHWPSNLYQEHRYG